METIQIIPRSFNLLKRNTSNRKQERDKLTFHHYCRQSNSEEIQVVYRYVPSSDEEIQVVYVPKTSPEQ